MRIQIFDGCSEFKQEYLKIKVFSDILLTDGRSQFSDRRQFLTLRDILGGNL